MISMLSYFKRKFKPRCVGIRSPSGSFERRNSFDSGKIAQNLNDNIKQKSESKLNTSKIKRLVDNFRLMQRLMIIYYKKTTYNNKHKVLIRSKNIVKQRNLSSYLNKNLQTYLINRKKHIQQ